MTESNFFCTSLSDSAARANSLQLPHHSVIKSIRMGFPVLADMALASLSVVAVPAWRLITPKDRSQNKINNLCIFSPVIDLR